MAWPPNLDNVVGLWLFLALVGVITLASISVMAIRSVLGG